MADEAAHLRAVAQFVPADPGNPHDAVIWRQRNDLVQAAGRHIQRMQKTLTQMNVQLANVLSDISGATGQAIIKAILDGQRDPHKITADALAQTENRLVRSATHFLMLERAESAEPRRFYVFRDV